MTQITKAQLRVLTAIQQHLHARGIPPSQRELARALGIALGAANAHVQNLRALGVLVDAPKNAGRTTAPARGVRVVVNF
jgi:biotin operon repressor